MKYLSCLLTLLINYVGGNTNDNNEQGRNFIQAVSKILDTEDLLTILKLGRDSDIAEQVLFEVRERSIENVVYTLLSKDVPVAGSTDNLENILSHEELTQLQLIPNGVFNAWSNKAYHKIIKYIDNLAKHLDDLLTMDKSGNQVTIVMTILQGLLEFAASDQRFTGVIPPYYNPDDGDWFGGGSNDNHHGFVGLYNTTDYNEDHQM